MSNSNSWVELEVLEVCYQVKYWEQTCGLLGIEVWALIGMPALWPWTAGLNMHLYITLQAKGLCLLLGVQQRGSPSQKPGKCSCTAQVHPSHPLHSHLAPSGWLWCVWWQEDRGAQALPRPGCLSSTAPRSQPRSWAPAWEMCCRTPVEESWMQPEGTEVSEPG